MRGFYHNIEKGVHEADAIWSLLDIRLIIFIKGI